MRTKKEILKDVFEADLTSFNEIGINAIVQNLAILVEVMTDIRDLSAPKED